MDHSRAARALRMAICVTALCDSALADHCPSGIEVAGAPESMLAGIAFDLGGFKRVLVQYGKPATTENLPDPSLPSGSGESRYTWTVGDVQLEVFTAHYTKAGKRVETVESVRVDGTRGGRRLRTSRGLRLGDTFSRAVLLYGPEYHPDAVNGPDLGESTRTFCFTDETELTVGVSSAGKVVAIWLAPSAE